MSKAVIAKNWTGLTTAGGVSYSNPAQAPDSQVPTTPGTPTVTAVGSTSLSLAWTASTDDSGVAYYIIYRSTSSGGSSSYGGGTPVPEPGMAGLFGLGAVAAAWGRRKRLGKKQKPKQ